MKILIQTVLAILFLVTIAACVDKNFNNVVDNSYYTPEYSLPIGDYTFKMESIYRQYNSSFVEIPDSLCNSDTLFVINYDSVFYTTPQYFNDSLIENFDFSYLTKNINYVTELIFRLNYVNKIPAKVTYQVYFLDVLHNPLDSLFKQEWMKIDAATVYPDGTLNKAAELWKYNIPLDTTTINHLATLYYIKIASRLELEDYTISQTRYFSSQDFWAQFAFRIKFDIPLNEI